MPMSVYATGLTLTPAILDFTYATTHSDVLIEALSPIKLSKCKSTMRNVLSEIYK